MVDVLVSGLADVLKDVRQMQERIVHPSPFYRRAAMEMYRDVIGHFSSEEGPKHQPWADWTPAYARWRAAHRGGTKKLQGSGVLRGSILFDSTETNARVFTNLVYAAPHNFGFPGPDRRGRMSNIPRREFMYLSDGLADRIIGRLPEWIIAGRA